MKIFVIIVLYNPEVDNVVKLCKNLENQGVEYFYVCNNSNYDISLDIANVQLEIINFGKNLGIAEAQNVGMEKAFSAGADFVIQMDQDSEPDSQMVKHLIAGYERAVKNKMKVGIVGSLDVDKVTGEKNGKRLKTGTWREQAELYDVSYTLSSGSLIPAEAHKTVGGMMSGLFIDYVDHEYCWRLQSHGFRTLVNPAAVLNHRLGNGRKKIPLVGSIGITSPFRLYYSFRNMILLTKEKHIPIGWKIKTLISIPLKLIIYFIFLSNRMERLKYIFRGLFDGFRGKSGKLD